MIRDDFLPSPVPGSRGLKAQTLGSEYTVPFFLSFSYFQDPFVQSGKAATRIRRWLRLSEVSWLLQYHHGFINSLDRTYIIPKHLLDFLEKKTSQRCKIHCRMSSLWIFPRASLWISISFSFIFIFAIHKCFKKDFNFWFDRFFLKIHKHVWSYVHNMFVFYESNSIYSITIQKVH